MLGSSYIYKHWNQVVRNSWHCWKDWVDQKQWSCMYHQSVSVHSYQVRLPYQTALWPPWTSTAIISTFSSFHTKSCRYVSMKSLSLLSISVIITVRCWRCLILSIYRFSIWYLGAPLFLWLIASNITQHSKLLCSSSRWM